MNRQLNSAKEMIRRLAFLSYILLFMIVGFELVLTLARPDIKNLALASVSFPLAFLLRFAGYRWLEFGRLFESFPTGCARDVVPEKIRTEVECLVDEFHAPHTDWVRRLQIRRRLVEIEKMQPEIREAYSADLKQVLAA